MSTRRKLSDADLTRARQVVGLAWQDLPEQHRSLLQSIGADQYQVVDRPLGQEIADLRLSAGHQEPDEATRRGLDLTLGTWVPDLRLILLDAGHPQYAGLNDTTYDFVLTRTAWHEWGHALSIDRSTREDVDASDELLSLAPEGLARAIRRAGYRRHQQTHELVAEIYASLMVRRSNGQTGKPKWLATEIWNLVRRVTGWND